MVAERTPESSTPPSQRPKVSERPSWAVRFKLPLIEITLIVTLSMVAFEVVQRTAFAFSTFWQGLVQVVIAGMLSAGAGAYWGLRRQRQLIHGIASELTDRRQCERAVEESRTFLEATLEALPEHIAILDEFGNILKVNGAWRRFGAENGLLIPNHAVGTNYLETCRRSSGEGAAEAHAVAKGIQEVIAEQRDEFRWEYPCHSLTKKRWFIMRVNRMVWPGRRAWWLPTRTSRLAAWLSKRHASASKIFGGLSPTCPT